MRTFADIHNKRRWDIYIALITGRRAQICKMEGLQRKEYFNELFWIANQAAESYTEGVSNDEAGRS